MGPSRQYLQGQQRADGARESAGFRPPVESSDIGDGRNSRLWRATPTQPARLWVALREAGILRPSDAAYKRGAQFLIQTQFEDGSWYVRSRSIPFRPYFESGFPFGRDQFISAAATNWAAMALVPLAH